MPAPNQILQYRRTDRPGGVNSDTPDRLVIGMAVLTPWCEAEVVGLKEMGQTVAEEVDFVGHSAVSKPESLDIHCAATQPVKGDPSLDSSQ